MVLTKKSFDVLRGSLFGTFTQSQVDALNYIVKKCEEAGLSYPEAAYALATVYHETGIVQGGTLVRTMSPVKERGSESYLRGKRYYPYIGYGLVQLTWKDNYHRVGNLIGENLVKYPEKALEWETATKILTEGMKYGWFTGVGFRRKCSVSRYNRSKYIRARKIINGTDKAALIADYAMTFEKALRS